MALPTSRNTTYAVKSQVKSADLNDIQDKIIDAHVDGVHGNFELIIPAAAAQGDEGTFSFDGDAWFSDDTATGNIYYPILLPAGSRINAITIDILEPDSAPEAIIASIHEQTDVDTSVQISTNKTSGSSGGKATLGWTSSDTDIPKTLSADKAYRIRVQLAATTTQGEAKCGQIRVQYDRPKP